MKLLNCDIVNFGTLSNYQYDFKDGLNVIKEANGFGKSTLAAFIKAMFYGIDNSRSKNIEDNERKKYAPWNGGKFGGSLDFEYQGKAYRIEKFFGATSKSDKVRVIYLKTYKDTNDFLDLHHIGKEIFGIDAVSFEKSSFFPQYQSDSKITDDLRSKLTDLVEDSDDYIGFDAAIKILEKRRNSYRLNKNKGFIVDVENEIDALKEQLENLNNKNSLLKDKQENITKLYLLKENISKELEKVKLNQKLNNENKVLLEIRKQYQAYKDEISSLEYKIKALELKNIPNNDIFEEISEKINKYNLLSEQIKNLEVNDYQEKLLNLDKKNASQLTEENINQLEEAVGEYNSLKSIETNEEVINEYNVLKEKFKDNDIISDIEELKNTLNEYNNAPKKKIISIKNLVLYSIGIILFIVGIILNKNTALMVTLISLAIGFAVFATLLFFIGNNKDKKEHRNLKQKIESIIIKYTDLKINYYESLANVENEWKKYNDYKKIIINDKEKNSIYNKQKEELEKKISQIFNFYNIEYQNYIDGISKIHLLYIDYCNLKEKLESDNKKSINLTNDLSNYILYFEKTFDEYGIIGSDYFKNIQDLRDRKKEYDLLKKSLSDLCLKKNEFVKEKNINSDSFDNLVEEDKQKELDDKYNSLNQNLQNIIRELTACEKDYNHILEECDDIEDVEAMLENKILEKERLNKELEITEQVIKYLNISKDNLSTSYLYPMEKTFVQYLNLIVNDFDNIMINSEFEVEAKRYGESKELGYFSKGYQDLINVCMRLALVDNLYKNEKPALILDDPFVNLDDDKLVNARKLLNEISKDFQVIYLVCHTSRV